MRGGLNTKLHAVRDGGCKLAAILLSEGQISDLSGAAVLADKPPLAKRLIADSGYGSDHFRRWMYNLAAAGRSGASSILPENEDG